MSMSGKRAIVCSHISSAFSQPTFYTVPPARISRHGQQQQPSMHASKRLLSKIKNVVEGSSGARNGARPKPNSAGFSQSLEEHALQASITSLPLLGDVLIRITHSGYVLELTLLDWLEGSPVCWEFSERIVPMPAVVLSSSSGNQGSLMRSANGTPSSRGREAFVYVLLEGGTLFRLSFPLTTPFFHDEHWIAKGGWFHEFTLPSTVTRPLAVNGCGMVLQGERTIAIPVNSGAYLYLDIDLSNDGQLPDKLHYPQHHSLLSKMFRTAQEQDSIISMASIDVNGTNMLFSISRDRSLRVWDKHRGNTTSHSLPATRSPDVATGNSLIDQRRSSSVVRGSSVAPQSAIPDHNTAPPLLPPERHTFLRLYFATNSPSVNSLRIVVFMPTPPGLYSNSSSSSAGFFSLYKLVGSRFQKLGEKEASDRTERCFLRDFIIKKVTGGHAEFEIHCLWEHSGESMYEYTVLDMETASHPSHNRRHSNNGDISMREVGREVGSSGSDDEIDDYGMEWRLIPYLSTPVNSGGPPTADSIDFLASLDFTHPLIESTILQALFVPGPGGFSPYTISEALKDYVEAKRISVKGDNGSSDPNSALRKALSKQYPTLRERVAALVGAVAHEGQPSKDAKGTRSNIVDDEEINKILKLRRQWEGFLASCREIEKSGHWPVALGVVGTRGLGGGDSAVPLAGECVVIERERMGLVVNEDEPLELYRRVVREMQEVDRIAEETGEIQLPTTEDWSVFLLRLALSLKSLLSPSSWAEVAGQMSGVIKASISDHYGDILLDLGREIHLENLDATEWVFEQLDSLEDSEFAAGLDTISRLIQTTGVAEAADNVKQEDDEEEVDRMLLQSDPRSSLVATGGVAGANALLGEINNHTQWSKSLTASYLSATLDARYEVASSIVFLLMFIIFSQREESPSPTAIVIDELFAGLRSSSILRQIASRAVEGDMDDPADGLQSVFPTIAPARAGPRHMRAGTADSMSLRLAGMQVGAGEASVTSPSGPTEVFLPPSVGSTFPSLPPTVRGSGSSPLLQSLLPPLKRSFSLPYASDAFLYTNGIICSDSLLVACQAEVKFADDLRKREHFRAAANVIDWLPKNDACCYLAGLLLMQLGRHEDSIGFFERCARSFGPMASRNRTSEQALIAVLPSSLSTLNSLPAYYEHVGRLFEEQGEHRPAVAFYRLATESADSDATLTDLWHSIFKERLANEDFELAYMCLAEMQDARLRNSSVTDLITTMCERNKVEMLLSFNFVGFQDEVEAELSFKARTSNPLQRPVYSKIYYSWSIKRGDYRGAASTMYQRARILGLMEKPDNDARHLHLSVQLEAYALAINALCLLDPQEAWISLPISEDSGMVPEEWRETNFGIYGIDDEKSRDSEIIELSDMRKELELCRARRQLVVEKMSIRGFVEEPDFFISPMEVVRRYAQIGMYDEALYSAKVFEVDMSPIFSAMVDMCMVLSKEGPAASSEKESHWSGREMVVGWEGNKTQKAWRLLQESLDRHDTSSTGWQYRKNCLERIMDQDRTSTPPTWLTAFFQEREPEYLIRTCLRYQLTLAAIDYTILMIKKANQPFAQGSTVSVTQTHLPYALIDAVVDAAQSKEEIRKAALIKAEIAARIGKVGSWDWH